MRQFLDGDPVGMGGGNRDYDPSPAPGEEAVELRSGWLRRPPATDGLLEALSRMLAEHGALSMAFGKRPEHRVVGAVVRSPEGICIECGRDTLFIDTSELDSIDVTAGMVLARGRFEGGKISWRPYVQRTNSRRLAARTCGGDAGLVCGAIQRMLDAASPVGAVTLTVNEPDEGPYKLQWHEFDPLNGEVVLMVGRLDRLREIRLRADRLANSQIAETHVSAESFRGRVVRLRIAPTEQGETAGLPTGGGQQA